MQKRELEIIDKISKIIIEHVESNRIWLFGSRSKGTNEIHADFDIAVDGKRPAPSEETAMTNAIEGIAGLYKIDVVFFDAIEPGFKDIIEKTGKIIYERRA